jgi:hypothetical protein
MMEEKKLDYSDIIFQQGELMNKHIKSFEGKGLNMEDYIVETKVFMKTIH